MKELLEQLQKLSAPPMMNDGYVSAYADGVHDAIELITEHLKDKVIVPVEPTTEMEDAYYAEIEKAGMGKWRPTFGRGYKSMLSAISEGDK